MRARQDPFFDVRRRRTSRARVSRAVRWIALAAIELAVHAQEVFSPSSVSLDVSAETSALGPLFHAQSNDTVRQWALSPFWSQTVTLALEKKEVDVLYPLINYDRTGNEYRFQILQLLAFAGGDEQSGASRNRFSLAPFYFHQRSPIPDQNYTALFPFYGTVKGRFLRDEVSVVLFPLYSRTRKRDVVTHNALYPFFHRRVGDGLTGWQFWPIIGYEKKEPTERVDGFGDTHVVGGHKKLSLLWPFYFDHRTGLGTDAPRRQLAVPPLFLRDTSPGRDYLGAPYPFFSRVHNRIADYREYAFPWPFLGYATGPGKRALRLWPLYARADTKTMASRTYFWPLWKSETKRDTGFERVRSRALHFLYSDTKETDRSTWDTRRRVSLWPLFTYERGFDNASRFQTLSLLEPLLPGNKSVRRNHAPLWSLYTSERDRTRGTQKTSWLLNLYRSEKTPERVRRWLLFGLLRWERPANANERHTLAF